MLAAKTAKGLVHEWVRACMTTADINPKAAFNELLQGRTKQEIALLYAERLRLWKSLDMRTHITKVTLSSAKQDWLTPPYFLDLVRQVGPIALDPCANPMSFVRAWWSFYGCNHVDGLSVRWVIPENTVCFVNPPYGRTLHLWAAKMASEGSSVIRDAGAHEIALIPARTGTGYWEQFIWPFADAVCFWSGGNQHPSRMCFYTLDGRPAETGATFDAAVVYFGKNRNRFKEVFESYGTIQFVN